VLVLQPLHELNRQGRRGQGRGGGEWWLWVVGTHVQRAR
jgi:hypothetical protein